jgi:hypothetical protein
MCALTEREIEDVKRLEQRDVGFATVPPAVAAMGCAAVDTQVLWPRHTIEALQRSRLLDRLEPWFERLESGGRQPVASTFLVDLLTCDVGLAVLLAHGEHLREGTEAWRREEAHVRPDEGVVERLKEHSLSCTQAREKGTCAARR